MIFKKSSVLATSEILFNSHYVAIPYDLTDLTSLATNGAIPAGTIIPANDETAVGVLLHDVVLAENPNGTVVIDGFIKSEKMAVEPEATAIEAMKKITIMDANGKPAYAKYSVTYDKGAAASGTAPTDSSSPYVSGATVTVLGNTGSLVGPEGTTVFKGWNTKSDGTGTTYTSGQTFTISANTTLYAKFGAS